VTEETVPETPVEGLVLPSGAPIQNAQPEEPTPDSGEQTEPQPGEALQTEAAFVVFKLPDGRWVANTEILGKPIMVGREATMLDMRHAAHDIIDDILIQQSAEQNMMLQRMAVEGIRRSQEYARIAEQMKITGPGMPGTGRN